MTRAKRKNKTVVILHTIVICTWTVIMTLLFALLAIIFSFFSKTGNSVHWVARVWGKSLLLGSFIRVHIDGLSHLSANQSCIFMSNHQSNFDIPVLLSKLPVQFRWLAKAELFKIPIFGHGMRGAGYISIDRSNRKAAFQSLARAAEIIRNGTSVLVFPEGTRSSDGRLQPFKKGGFVLAVDAGVPIIPVVIQGTHAIMSKNSLLIRPQPVQVRLKAPIETRDYTRKTKEELMARVYAAMAADLSPHPEGARDA